MAADYISINAGTTTATRAAALKSAIAQFRQAQQALATELAIMNHCFDSGPPAVFTVLETQYGLAQGEGQTIFNMVNGAVGAMNGQFQNNQSILLVSQVG